MIRDIVRAMDPELRQMWAQAIAHEEAVRVQGTPTTDAYYAWNKVDKAVYEAVKCEKECSEQHAEHKRLRGPTHG